MHPASRFFPSSFLRYEHCLEPYARARPPHGVQLGTRHPTTRANVSSAKKRLRNFQELQRERKGCIFRSQQVLPKRALALKKINNGLHHVGRYPDLKAREMCRRSAIPLLVGRSDHHPLAERGQRLHAPPCRPQRCRDTSWTTSFSAASDPVRVVRRLSRLALPWFRRWLAAATGRADRQLPRLATQRDFQ